MTLQSIGAALQWPGWGTFVTAANALGDLTTIDAAGEYTSWIGQARESMTISHVAVVIGSATGSPTADIRIETVDGTGLPSGTLWAANTNAVTATLTNGNNLTALTASASITAGQMFCVKCVYNSGTAFRTQSLQHLIPRGNLPYYVNNTGTPTKNSISSGTWCAALGSSSTTFYNVVGMMPIITSASTTFNNTSSARRGLRFKVPFKCRCVGMYTMASTATGDYNAILFDDAGTELSSSSTAFDGDQSSLSNSAASNLIFDSPVALSPATWYRAALEPTSATNISFILMTMPSSSYIGGTPWSVNAHYATYVASSWTDTGTDKLPIMGILIDQLDDAVNAASSGGSYTFA